MQNNNTKYSQEEELKLINSAKLNPDFFGPLYNRYYHPIFLFIFKRYKDKELCADITSQVFLKAMLNITKYVDKGYPFSAWLYRIALNEMNMYHRKHSKYFEIEIKEKDVKLILEEIDHETIEKNIDKLLLALEKMTDEQQQLIQLRFFDHLSFKEIGDILAISEDNAKVRVYRTLDKLKKMTGDYIE